MTETNSVMATNVPDAERFSWGQIASDDFKIYRDRLRAVGCPDETVRDIITAEIAEKFRPRRVEIIRNVQVRYWEITVQGKKAFEEWESALDKLDIEQEALIEEVLGKDADERTEQEGLTHYWERSYAWLPADKQKVLIDLELESQKRTRAIWAEVGKRQDQVATDEEQQKIKALEDELAAARQRLLSPEEYLEYRLRNSHAGNWPSRLGGFEATEAEWRAVAQLKLEYDEALQKIAPDLDETSRKTTAGPHSQMQRELDAAMKSALGATRFAEYQLAANSDYQQTRRITERYQLPESLARQAYELQRTAEAHAESARTDASLSDEARNRALIAIRQETERALTGTLGTKVFNTYQEYHGNWLKQLDQTPGEQ